MTHARNGYRALCQALAEDLAGAGFDLVQAAQVGWYNDAVDAVYRLPDLGSAENLVVVVANTRALWPVFVRAYRDDETLARARDPLNRYTERTVSQVVATLDVASEVRFSHEAPPRRVAMQTLAHVSGLAYRTPSYLSVHPVFGPWIALRAAVVLPIPGPPGPAPSWQAPCACTDHCTGPFERACALVEREPAVDSRAIANHWRAWLAVRDACPVGRDHRYSEAQIEYHYTKNRGCIVDDA